MTVIEEIEALELHYFRPVRTPDERERWLADYIEDLGDLSPQDLHAACRAWRQSGSKKFPTSGQLRAMAPMHASAGEKLEPWRPLTDEEYEALSLAGKVRHQRILAHEAELKAGPQMRRGIPIPAEEMHEAWHFWRERARHHMAESGRLLRILQDAKERHA